MHRTGRDVVDIGYKARMVAGPTPWPQVQAQHAMFIRKYLPDCIAMACRYPRRALFLVSGSGGHPNDSSSGATPGVLGGCFVDVAEEVHMRVSA